MNNHEFDYMKSNKTNLKNIVIDDNLVIKINLMVNKINKIVTHTYQFIKLWLLYLNKFNKKIPIINNKCINWIFLLVSKLKKRNMPQPKNVEFINLKLFYDNSYSKTITDKEIIYRDKLNYSLKYEAIEIITNIENNIKEHFIDHLNRYVNLTFRYKKVQAQIKKVKDKETRNKYYLKLNKKFRLIKNDLKSLDSELKSKPKYHKWILEKRELFFPGKKEFNKNIYYEVASKPQNFLQSMIRLCIEFEKMNVENKENKENEIKLFNIIPLRTNIIPKHICIDTSSLIDNFLTEKKDYYRMNYKKQKFMQKNLWNKFFYLSEKVFKKGKDYKFNHMIKTDGISCSIIFIKLDQNGIPVSKKFKNFKKEDSVKYIEKIKITENIKKKKVIAIDMGKMDLAYCGSMNKEKELTTFRYTKAQRRMELGTERHTEIRNKLSNLTKINGKTIKELETELSFYNSKTCNYESFKKYCKIKNKLNNKLFIFYKQKIFRKLKLRSFIRTQKSESKFVRNFKNKFGNEKNSIVVIGDWSNTSIKNTEPTIGKRLRTILGRAKYKTYLIDEYKTSKICNGCCGELEKFLDKKHENGNFYKCHGLLRCKSQNCGIIHNRDKNAVRNMLNIVQNIFSHNTRPEIFTRPFKTTGENISHPKPKFLPKLDGTSKMGFSNEKL